MAASTNSAESFPNPDCVSQTCVHFQVYKDIVYVKIILIWEENILIYRPEKIILVLTITPESISKYVNMTRIMMNK